MSPTVLPCPSPSAGKSVVPAVISGSERMIKNGGFPRYVFADSVAISLSCRWTWQHYHFAFDTVEDKAVGTPRSKYTAFIGRSCPIHHGLTPEHCVIPVHKSPRGRYLLPCYKANKGCHFKVYMKTLWSGNSTDVLIRRAWRHKKQGNFQNQFI